MSFSGWTSPEDLAEQEAANAADAAAQREAARTQQRLKMSPFERQLIDVLTEIRDAIWSTFETSAAGGDAGVASAEPVDRAGPGSARPEPAEQT